MTTPLTTDVDRPSSPSGGIVEESPRASVLGAARARRRWSIEEAARRADLDSKVVEALEEARVYRFGSTQDALAAAVVYAAALGIDVRRSRELVGLPVRTRLLAAVLSMRFVVAVALVGALGALSWLAIDARRQPAKPALPAHAATTLSADEAAALPAPWEIHVAVYNGSAERRSATLVANRIAALGYGIAAVANARRHDYPLTHVYYPPGAEAIGQRLAQQLGVSPEALQAGRDPLSLVVIVGAKL